MNQPIIVVSSVTYAMKGRDLLNQQGIRAYIERIQRGGANGCGYGLYLPEEADRAEGILRAAGIRVLGRRDRGAL